MIKYCEFAPINDQGIQVVEFLHHPDQLHHSYMDKLASPYLPEIREYLDRLKPNHNSVYALINALGAFEYWGCFPDGTPVKTRDGHVSIEDVVVGSEVLTHKNRYRKVTNKKRFTVDWELVGLNIRGLPQLEPFIEATPQHEFWVVTRDEMIKKRREHFYYRKGSREERRMAFVKELEFDWVEIGNLRKGDYVAQPFPLEEDSPLAETWGSPEIAKLAGIYAADGCKFNKYDKDMLPETDSTFGVIYTIGDSKPGVVETIKECAAKFGYTINVKHIKDRHTYRVQLSWADFGRFCRDHIGDHAVTKFLSGDILRMPLSWQEEFFRYYHNGDGNIVNSEKGKDTYVCSTASLRLALDMRLMLARLGYLSSVSGRHNTKSNWYTGKPIYHLCVGGSQINGDVKNVAGYLHPSGYILAPIKDTVCRAFSGYVNDLEVEEDTSFTACGISVHNSNANADAFEEEHLIHRGPIWGYETFMHYARPCMHHCFVAGTMVLMADRTRKPIEEVRVGEMVVTSKGPRKVLRTFSRHYTGEGAKITLHGEYEPLITDIEHPHFVYPREAIHCKHKYSRLNPESYHFKESQECSAAIGEPVVTEAYKILPGDYLVYPAPQHGDMRVREEFASLVGWIAADGYVPGNGIIQFTLSLPEKIKAVVEVLEANKLHVTKTLRKNDGQWAITATSKDLSDEICEYVNGTYADKTMSGKILEWDGDALHRMIGSYINGDGHIPEDGRNRGQLRIRSASKQMLRILSDALRSLRIPTTTQWDIPAGYVTLPGDNICWTNGSGTVTVTPQYSVQASKYSYKTVDVGKTRQYASPFFGDYYLVRVHDAEDIDLDEEIYNLEVEDNHEYVANGAMTHNCNKGPNHRFFGDVELSCWNPSMHRIEVVARLDRDMGEKVNAHRVFDKIDHGELPSCSMGTKVPYDLSSMSTDWELYRKALDRFNPRRHRHPGVAALEYHKTVRRIPGLSVTRDDYDSWMQHQANEILPDGRKVFVYNPYPRFFDISFVFIGAEKTSKMMAKLAESRRSTFVVPKNYGDGWHEQPGTHKEMAKVASVETARAKLREFGKRASHRKRAEIIKDVVPSQFMAKAVPILERSEPDLPKDLLEQMSKGSLREALSTPTMLGITLKPREFQRITLCRLGKQGLADDLDQKNQIFRNVEDTDRSIPLGGSFISALLGKLLGPHIDQRSALGPPLTRRMIRITICGAKKPEPEPEEIKDDLLDKVSSAYNGYREQLVEKVAELSDHLASYPELMARVFDKDTEDLFVKEAAGIDPRLLIGAVPATYLLSALAKRKVRRDFYKGKQPSILTEFVADHPHIAASAIGLAALKASGSDIPDKLLKGALSLGKKALA